MTATSDHRPPVPPGLAARACYSAAELAPGEAPVWSGPMADRTDSPEARAAIVEELRRALEGRPEILWAVVHGSFVEGGPYRDVDVGVWLDPGRPGTEWRRYEIELAAALHLELHQPVDVRVLNDAPVTFRYHALNGAPLIVRDRDAFDDTRARTWDEYFDFLPFARQYLREVLGA